MSEKPAMTTPVAEPKSQQALEDDAGSGWPCSWTGCSRPAVAAATFRDQPGHVHDCGPHIAELREWTDVTAVVPLPCPFTHGDGATWTDTPRELT